jgi:hypothetical protein
VFEVSAAQDFNVTLGSSIDEISKEMSTWKSLDNEEWQRIYATSTVPGYSDLHLLIDQVSYGMRMHRNWSYTLESPANMSCDWPAISYDDLNFDVRMHHDQKSSTLGPMEIQPFRFFRSLVYLPDTNQTLPDSPWPGPRSIQAGEAVGVQGVLAACPKNGWLGPSTAFHVKEARAKVNSYANRVQIAIPFLSIVIIANFIKVIAIYRTIRIQSSGHLITAGDAIASFLEHPEPATRGMCTLTKSQLCSPGSEKEAKPWQVVKEPMAVVLGGSRMWSGIIMYVSRVCALPYRLYPSKKTTTHATTLPANDTSIGSFTLCMAAVTIATSGTPNLSSWGTSARETIPFTSTTFDARGALSVAGVSLAAVLLAQPHVHLAVLRARVEQLRHAAQGAPHYDARGPAAQHALLAVAAALGGAAERRVRTAALAAVAGAVPRAARAADARERTVPRVDVRVWVFDAESGRVCARVLRAASRRAVPLAAEDGGVHSARVSL